MYTQYRLEAQAQWQQARRKAFWTRVLSHLRGECACLLDFNEVSQRLRLMNTSYRGVENIPLDKIVGSVGRYQDFMGAFLPLTDAMGPRWQVIAEMHLDPNARGLPPIEVFKVSQWYFVKDGNHRVSVEEQLGATHMEAYVWEFTDALPDITPDADIDALLIAAEKEQFFEQTCLHTLRPDHGIVLSAPGGYTEMLFHITHFQDVLGLIDNREVPYPEAVTAWYDMIYETSIQLIHDSSVLESFPTRSAADLFVWIIRHRQELEAQVGGNVHVKDAALTFKKQHRWTALKNDVSALSKKLVFQRD